MRQKLSLTGGIFPMPVLMIATYNEDGSVDVMNAAWGTMLDMSVVALNLSESHRTMENIRRSGAFTVSVADAAHVTEADYFGVVSAKNEPRKFEKSGLTAVRTETVDAPAICEFPLCLECQYLGYEGGEHGIGAIGRVVNVTADERVMTDGKIDMQKVDAIAFDQYTNGYYRIGERVGEAFRCGLKLK